MTRRRPIAHYCELFGAIESESLYMWCAVDQFGWRPLKECYGVTVRGGLARVERAWSASDRSGIFGRPRETTETMMGQMMRQMFKKEAKEKVGVLVMRRLNLIVALLVIHSALAVVGFAIALMRFVL